MGVISELCATKKPIDNSVAERQPGEHDSSLDVDIYNQHRGNGQNHLQVWRLVNSNPCLDWFRGKTAHDHRNHQMLLQAIVLDSNFAWMRYPQVFPHHACKIGDRKERNIPNLTEMWYGRAAVTTVGRITRSIHTDEHRHRVAFKTHHTFTCNDAFQSRYIHLSRRHSFIG